MRECSFPTKCHMSHVSCQVSGVRCQVSGVRCHMSNVRYHMSGVTCHFFVCFFGQIGGARWWRVCYQWGLPRLVIADLYCSPVFNSFYLSIKSPSLSNQMGLHSQQKQGHIQKKMYQIYCAINFCLNY